MHWRLWYSCGWFCKTRRQHWPQTIIIQCSDWFHKASDASVLCLRWPISISWSLPDRLFREGSKFLIADIVGEIFFHKSGWNVSDQLCLRLYEDTAEVPYNGHQSDRKDTPLVVIQHAIFVKPFNLHQCFHCQGHQEYIKCKTVLSSNLSVTYLTVESLRFSPPYSLSVFLDGWCP